MITLPLLLAAGGDIADFVKLIMVVIFIIGALIKALTNAAKAANQQKGRPPVPNLQSIRPDPTPETTVQDFLDRVNRQRAEARKPQGRQEPAYLEAEVIDADFSGSESVSQHVTRNMGSSGLASRSLPHERLTSDDAARDVNIRKFQHQVGRLSETGEKVVVTESELSMAAGAPLAADASLGASAATADLFALLRSPQGLRQVVILNEILNRPEMTR